MFCFVVKEASNRGTVISEPSPYFGSISITTDLGTREAVLLCLFRVMVSGHYDISFDVIPSQHLRHRRAVSVCVSSPGSTHTRPVPMCQQCSASIASVLISHRPASQPPLRHIRTGLCVHLHSRVSTTAGTREAVLLCLFRVMVSGHYDISFVVIPSQHSRHRRAVSVCG